MRQNSHFPTTDARRQKYEPGYRHLSIEYNSDISSTGTGGDVAIANLDCSDVMFRLIIS